MFFIRSLIFCHKWHHFQTWKYTLIPINLSECDNYVCIQRVFCVVNNIISTQHIVHLNLCCRGDLLIYFLKRSGAKAPPEKTVHFLEETFSVATRSRWDHSGEPAPAAGVLRSNSSAPPDHDQTRSIKQEVERLMQDHNTFTSSKPSRAPSACTQAVRQTVFSLLMFSSALSLGCLQLFPWAK